MVLVVVLAVRLTLGDMDVEGFVLLELDQPEDDVVEVRVEEVVDASLQSSPHHDPACRFGRVLYTTTSPSIWQTY